jgi:serine/threonine protein kinase
MKFFLIASVCLINLFAGCTTEHSETISKRPSVEKPKINLKKPVSVKLIEKPATPKPVPKPPVLEPPKPKVKTVACGRLMAEFRSPEQFLVKSSSIRDRFTLLKDLRGESKSGAFPAIMSSRENKKSYFLKVFPLLKESGQNEEQIKKLQSYLEIFQSCRLTDINVNQHLPVNKKASDFFVKIYEFGFLDVNNPFIENNHKANTYFPYIITEAVNNISLTKFVTDPEAAKKDLGYTLETAPPKVIESILLQIVVALKNPYLAWNLVHNDLHTGNILLSTDEKADFTIDFNGKKMRLAGPLVKIIDFGLGESEELSQNLSLWNRKRFFIWELEKFISAIRGRLGTISIRGRTKIHKQSLNQDIAMVNLIMRALKFVLAKRGSVIQSREYCKDYDECLNIISRWWN